MKDIREIKDLLDVHEYGLPLPVLILASKDEYLMKCVNRYYIYHDIWCDLNRVEEPTELSQILRTLGNRDWEGVKLTECDPLPEYGGPYYVADEEVPPGWSNRIDQGIYDKEFFDLHDISRPSLLLFHEADQSLPALYFIKGFNPSRFYIWNVNSGKISKIEEPRTLHDILDTLKGYFDELKLLFVERRFHP